MKHLLLFGFALAMTYMVASCGPSVTTSDPINKLDTFITGSVTASGGIRLYQLDLTCGCPFAMRIDGADTTSIVYDTRDLSTITRPHAVKASLRSGLSSGMHTGWVLLHMAPPSLDTFYVTLRDTVMVP